MLVTLRPATRPRPARSAPLPKHAPPPAGAEQIAAEGLVDPHRLRPHPDDAPPWWPGSTAQADAGAAEFDLIGTGTGPAVVRTPFACFARGRGVERSVREQFDMVFGVGDIVVREGAGPVRRRSGTVRGVGGNVIAVPPGLAARLFRIMHDAYPGGEVQSHLRDVEDYFRRLHRESAGDFRQTGVPADGERAEILDRLAAWGGGVLVAEGEDAVDRTRAIAWSCKLARRGPAVVYAGSLKTAGELGEHLGAILGGTHAVHVDPDANAWSVWDDDAPGGESHETFGPGDVVVVASAQSPGAPHTPEVAVFADADHAWGRPRRDDSLDPADECFPGGIPTDYGGIVLPHLRRVAARLVGIVTPRQARAGGEVRLCREAALGPTLNGPPHMEHGAEGVRDTAFPADDPAAIADRVRRELGGGDGAALVVTAGPGAAENVAAALGWPVIGRGHAGPVPRRAVMTRVAFGRGGWPRPDVLVWAAPGSPGPAAGSCVVICTGGGAA